MLGRIIPGRRHPPAGTLHPDKYQPVAGPRRISGISRIASPVIAHPVEFAPLRVDTMVAMLSCSRMT
jgi:hypothetical protein